MALPALFVFLVRQWVTKSKRLPKAIGRIQPYDTDHSIQAIDMKIKISKASSGLDPG